MKKFYNNARVRKTAVPVPQKKLNFNNSTK